MGKFADEILRSASQPRPQASAAPSGGRFADEILGAGAPVQAAPQPRELPQIPPPPPGYKAPVRPPGYVPPVPAFVQPPPGQLGQVPGGSETAASAGTLAKGSFASTMRDQIRMYAQARGLPESHYRVHQGQVVYFDPERGQWFPEIPTTSMFTDPTAQAQREMAGVGHLIPAATGTIAGVASAPLALTGPPGLAASAAFTGGAQGAGESARQGIGALLFGAQPRPRRIAEEAALGAAAELGGGIVARAMPKFSPSVREQIRAPIAGLEDASTRAGVPLTPAELTGQPKLVGEQRVLSSIPEASDVMMDFYRRRGEASEAAGRQFLESVSDVEGREVSGQLGSAAAQTVENIAKKARADQASPFYKRAFADAPTVDTTPVIGALDERIAKTAGGFRNKLMKVRGWLVDKVGKDEYRAVTDLEKLHNVKVQLGDEIEKAKRSGANALANDYQQIMNGLRDEMMAVSEPYRQGAAIYHDLSPGVERVGEGIVGYLSGLNERTYQNAANALFNAGPRAIGEARRQFMQADNTGRSWNGLVRSFLEQSFEKHGKEFFSRPDAGTIMRGPKWAADVYGDKVTRGKLKAAMSPEQYEAYESLMKVLQASGRALDINSDTAWKQAAQQELRSRTGRIRKTLVQPWQIFGNVAEWLEDAAFSKKAVDIANILTNEDSVKRLRAIRNVNPGSARAVTAVSHVLANIVQEQAGGNEPLPLPAGP